MILLAVPDVPDRTMSGSINAITQFLTLIFIFIIVIVITLIATRWIANYQKGSSLISGANIETVETYRLTANKYVQILRVGDKYLAVAVGRDEVTFLTELSPDEIRFKEAKVSNTPDFAGLLSKLKKSYQNRTLNNTDKDNNS